MATLVSTSVCGTYTSKYTVTEGTPCSFTKPDNSTTCEVFGCCVSLTRGAVGSVYNPFSETCYIDSQVSPQSLLFNVDGWSDLSDITHRNYGTFVNVLNNQVGNYVVGEEMIMWDTYNNAYHKICFTSWTQGGGGGGFAYVRTPLTLSDDTLIVSSASVGEKIIFPTDICLLGQNCYSSQTGTCVNLTQLSIGSCNKNILIGRCVFQDLSSPNEPLNRQNYHNIAIGNCIFHRNTTNTNTGVFFGNVLMGTSIGASQPQSTATSNYYNTVIGYNSMVNMGCCFASCCNTAVGTFSNQLMNCGIRNTAFGFYALRGNQTGSDNTALGTCALYNCSALTNATGVGYQAVVTGDNQVQIGNSSTTTYVYGTVQNRSDERDKSDIRDTTLGLDFISCLRPVDFKWDMRDDYIPEAPEMPEISEDLSDEEKIAIEEQFALDLEEWQQQNSHSVLSKDGTHKRNRFHHGLIAQEVKQVLDDMGLDFGGYQDHTIAGGESVLTIGYDEFIAPLIKSIQELKVQIETLENRIQTLESN